jgi:modified peptide precursor CbpA
MVKGTRWKPAERLDPPGFFMGPESHTTKETPMKKKERIIAYRRRCRNSANGTGLAHYILLAAKQDKQA